MKNAERKCYAVDCPRMTTTGSLYHRINDLSSTVYVESMTTGCTVFTRSSRLATWLARKGHAKGQAMPVLWSAYGMPRGIRCVS